MNPAKTVEVAVAEVEALLLAAWSNRPDDAKVELVMWGLTDAGPRVAEISSTAGNGGASAMQCYPDGLMLCALAERCILERMYPDLGDQEMYDEQLLEIFWED